MSSEGTGARAHTMMILMMIRQELQLDDMIGVCLLTGRFKTSVAAPASNSMETTLGASL